MNKSSKIHCTLLGIVSITVFATGQLIDEGPIASKWEDPFLAPPAADHNIKFPPIHDVGWYELSKYGDKYIELTGWLSVTGHPEDAEPTVRLYDFAESLKWERSGHRVYLEGISHSVLREAPGKVVTGLFVRVVGLAIADGSSGECCGGIEKIKYIDVLNVDPIKNWRIQVEGID